MFRSCATSKMWTTRVPSIDVPLQPQVEIAERHRVSGGRRAAHRNARRPRSRRSERQSALTLAERSPLTLRFAVSVVRRSLAPRGANGNVRSMEIAPGAFHLHALPVASTDQRALVDQCRALVDGAVPAYVPVVRGGGKMHVRMLCLGRHWNGKTYTYEATRSDFDDLPVPPLPDDVHARSRATSRASVGHDARRRSLHPQLLRRRRPDGAAPGQGRERAIDRRRAAGGVGVARRHGAVSVRRDCGAGIRSRRGCSNRATRSSSAARRGCAITACRASSRNSAAGARPHRPLQPHVSAIRCLTRPARASNRCSWSARSWHCRSLPRIR